MTLSKRLVTGSMQLTMSNAVVRLVAIVTMPVLTRLLSPQAYGAAALVGTMISLVAVIALAGIDMSYARAYPSVREPSGLVVERFCWRFALTTSFGAAVAAGLVWLWISGVHSNLAADLAWLLMAGVVLSAGQTLAMTRARLNGRYRALAIAVLASGLCTAAISVSIARWGRQDAWALIVAQLAGYLLPVLMLGVPSLHELVRSSGMAARERLDLIRVGAAGVVTAPMYWALSSSDRWFLQFFHGADAVGVYSIGYSVATAGAMLNSSITAIWLPEAAREYERDPDEARITLGRLMSRAIVAMAITWLIVATIGGDLVRILADERFCLAADYVPYIAAGVLFYGIAQLGFYGLVLVKQSGWAVYGWLAAGLLCLMLNLVLVPRYGGYGAAITQCASFGFVSVVVLIASQSRYRMSLGAVRLTGVALVVSGAGYFGSSAWGDSPLISVLLKLPLNLSVAALCAWIVAPDWLQRGLGLSVVRRATGGPDPLAVSPTQRGS